MVRLDDGAVVRYDALVLSPGISLDYDSVPGWGRDAEELMPHGWRAGHQTLLLKRKLAAVPDGGLVLLIAPPNPYRCPPAPYERVSLMARALLNSGRKRCKIIVLDPKPKFADQALFQEGWESIYPGMIEWINAGIYETIERVEPATNTVVTGFETYKGAALVNVIPAQAAAGVARAAGLADGTGFCPIDPSTMRSKVDSNSYIVGDSCDAGAMPKSASGAHCQAKVAAGAICETLIGRHRSTTEMRSMCFSAIDDDYAVRTSATYAVQDGSMRAVSELVSGGVESRGARRLTQAENMAWYANLFADVFR
jgi:NADPH-dependent 2,4-dienoyl-CoA reductase/sulfur reductase-like enzyme